MKLLVSVAACLLVCSTALATESVAVLPIVAPARDPITLKLSADVETAVVEAARKVGGVTLVNDDGGHLRAPHVDPRADTRPQTRGEALAKELAAVTIVAEPQPVGHGAVVYLTLVEPSGRVRGSTTVALSADALAQGGLQRPLRGGIVQVLYPARYTGRLELTVDVKDATIEVDGHPSAAMIGLSVGTHAVRVTHRAYHDWVRFVDVAFDQTRAESVALAAFPLTEGEMAEKRRHGAPLPPKKVPWFRSWWALTVGGVAIAGVTTGIVLGARPGLSNSNEAHYRAVPTP